MDGKKVIVVAHENVLRGIVQTLSNMSEEEVLNYNIPTATPFIYEFVIDFAELAELYLRRIRPWNYPSSANPYPCPPRYYYMLQLLNL